MVRHVPDCSSPTPETTPVLDDDPLLHDKVRNPWGVPSFEVLNSPEHWKELQDAWEKAVAKRPPPVEIPYTTASQHYSMVVAACSDLAPIAIRMADPKTPPPCLPAADVWNLAGTICHKRGRPLVRAMGLGLTNDSSFINDLLQIMAPGIVDIVQVVLEGRR